MADTSLPPAAPPTIQNITITAPTIGPIRIVSHSGLFYWWPVWFFAFAFALLTYIENNRLAVLPNASEIVITRNDAKQIESVKIEVAKPSTGYSEEMRLLKDSEQNNANADRRAPKARVTGKAWMGPSYLVILLLVVAITNIPLRGLWSLITIITIALLAVVFSLLEWWDNILRAFGDLHVYINMAGYLFIGTVLLILWAVAVFIFDQRAYMEFSPGQLKVKEEIGSGERAYDTVGMSVQKQRDDWFRHVILGFGTGDLIVKTSGADRHELRMPNVAMISSKIKAIEQMMSTKKMSS